ncbi:SpoIIE family protein phosphatase [Streptomyces sp. NPDC005728]|uniref:SpoIIE family protein phosphatase n=1 Tax=Streptomyces sp. NPDC005728 TaxID=3157054 RepID=UPI0033F58A70
MDRFPHAANVDFHSPLDLSKAAAAVLDDDGRISGWGSSAQRLLGHAPEDVLGQSAARLLAADPGQRLSALCKAPRPRSTVLDLSCRDGRTLRAAVTFSPLAHRGVAATVVVAAELEALRSWEAQLAMMQGLATESSVGLTIFDTDMRVVWGNVSTDLELAGVAQYIGRPAADLFPEGEFISRHHPPDEDQIMEHVLTTGEPIMGMHYRGRAPADPVREHVWSCSYHRLVDARGEPLGLFEESLDITDRYRAQERLSLLVRAGKRIGASLDVRRTAAELADVAVPQLADEVLVDLPPAVIEGRHPPTGSAPGHSLLRMHGRTPEEFRTSPVSYPPSSPQALSLATSRPVVDAVPPEGAPGQAGPAASHSCLFVPLLTRDAILGLATFRRSSNPDPFGPEEQTLAVELAERAAVGIDNARRYTSQHAAALVLQRSLLPQHLPEQSAVDVAYRYLPADSRVGVGGDWFDVIPLSGARVGLTVGDVVGHGVHAAATMGRLRATVRTLALLDLDPAELLTRLDDLVAQDSESQADDGPIDEALGVTCLYAIYDPVSGRCVWASAGHPPPIVADANGSVALSALAPGPPLGLGGLPYENVDLNLSSSSVVAFFTDGVVEDRRTDIDSGIDRLAQVLTWQRCPLEELCDRALSALPPGPQADDATLMLVRTRRLDADQVADLELPPDPTMVAHARTVTERQLATWDLSDLSFTAALVVSELVTNGIRYASGPVMLRLIRDRCLLCEVSDNAHTAPHLRRARRDDEGGRGLFLVAQMSQRWGTRYTASGKTIWAELALP